MHIHSSLRGYRSRGRPHLFHLIRRRRSSAFILYQLFSHRRKMALSFKPGRLRAAQAFNLDVTRNECMSTLCNEPSSPGWHEAHEFVHGDLLRCVDFLLALFYWFIPWQTLCPDLERHAKKIVGNCIAACCEQWIRYTLSSPEEFHVLRAIRWDLPYSLIDFSNHSSSDRSETPKNVSYLFADDQLN